MNSKQTKIQLRISTIFFLVSSQDNGFNFKLAGLLDWQWHNFYRSWKNAVWEQMCRCWYIDVSGEKKSLTTQHTMTLQSHTVPHSFKPSIDPFVNGSLGAHSCVVMGSLMNVMGNVLWEIPPFCAYSVVVDEKSFFITNFAHFIQINDKYLSVSIMLNAVL